MDPEFDNNDIGEGHNMAQTDNHMQHNENSTPAMPIDPDGPQLRCWGL